MAFEQLANNAGTTLNGTINNSVTSLVVTSATGFPSSGNFRILIDSEVLLVTAVSGTTFTVTRAQEGTAAASHTSGVNVDHVLTKGGLDQYLADRSMADTYANLPAAGVAGRRLLTTNGMYELRDDGSAWSAWGPIRKVSVPPASGSFTAVNSATISSTGGNLVVSKAGTGTAGGDSIAAAVLNVPSAPYTFIAGIIPTWGLQGFNSAGITLYDGTKFATFGLTWRTTGVTYNGTAGPNSSFYIQIDQYTNTTSFSASYLQAPASFSAHMHWLKIVDDNTNRTYYWSHDGITYTQLAQTTRTNFLTPTKAGLFVQTNTLAASTMSVNCFDWSLQ